MIKLLIVEDDPLYARQLYLMVTELGYEVSGICSSTQSTYKAIEINKPDLLLIDIRLGDSSDGIELAEEISIKNYAVILITQYGDDTLYERAKVIPNSSFLVKPFHRLSLKRQIEFLIPSKGQCLPTPINHEKKPDSPVDIDSIVTDKVAIRNRKWLDLIEPDKILWLEADGNYCIVQTEQNRYSLKRSLILTLKNLPQDQFIRVSRSFAIQAKHIDKVNFHKGLIWVGTKSFPLGRIYRKQVKKSFLKIG